MQNNFLKSRGYQRKDHSVFVDRTNILINSLPNYSGLKKLAENVCFGNGGYEYNYAYGLGYLQALSDIHDINDEESIQILSVLEQCCTVWRDYSNDEIVTILRTGSL